MGTWKLAYADFLTALAAFFLVMWLVKGVPDAGRAEIATYFEQGAREANLVATERPDPRTVLAGALQASPGLLTHLVQLDVATIPHGLRIDMMDRSDDPLFVLAASDATPAGAELMADVFSTLSALSFPLTIEGHTDAFVFNAGTADNWTLSMARADQARRIAIQAGIDPQRIAAVTGYADRRPRLPAEPHHPSNRRVTVILHVPSNESIPVS
ncbi:MAG: flagellar motor protein MotB [Pseudomonadota bacterium]